MANLYKIPKPVVLIIMDGVGVAPPGPGNAVTLANTVNLDKYWPKYPHAYLKASGREVGLPDGVDGNSEVGHMTIGTGKVLFQDLPRINNEIETGHFMKNKVLLDAVKYMKKHKSAIHVIGLLGDGEVHSSKKHLFKLIEFLSKQRLDKDKVYFHMFTDGRDSSPTAGSELVSELLLELERKRIGRLASFIGRYYGMDRDKRWDRTKKAYDLIVHSKGKKTKDPIKSLEEQYKKGVTDEYMTPHAVVDFEGKLVNVHENDVVINFNFRPDRAIQITKAFEDPNFSGFERKIIKGLFYAGFSDYKQGFPSHIIFPMEKARDNLGKVLSQHRLYQLRIAESEKFPHVTYFFDGGQKIIYPGEDQIEVPSPKNVATYDQIPEMSTFKITKVLLNKMQERDYDFVLVNFAAPDMVAHTGVLDAAVKAVEAVDKAIGQIVDFVLDKDGTILITADHGNAEELVNLRTGEIDTKHSTNPVPFLAINKTLSKGELPFGILADIAPTVLKLFGIDKPADMTGHSLL